MAEGTSTFMGLAPALLGESEIIQQTAATDIVTITGAASQTGDFIVCQNSSGAEVFVVSSSGGITARTYTLAAGLSSTTAAYGISVSVTSTGALAQGSVGSAFLVSMSSKAVLNAAYGYQSPDSAVGTAVTFCMVNGSKAPSYFISVGATAPGVGAATDNGFFEAATRFLTAPSTALTYGAIKILAGSKAYYIPCVPDTGMVDT